MPPSSAPTAIVVRTLAFRPRPTTTTTPTIAHPIRKLRPRNALRHPPQLRFYASGASNNAPINSSPSASATERPVVDPNMQQADHVSEEAAKLAKTLGGSGPDIQGQSTPVQDILQAEEEVRQQTPQAMKNDLQTEQGKAAHNFKPSNSSNSTGVRGFATMARRGMPEVEVNINTEMQPGQALDVAMLPDAQQRASFTAEHTPTTSSSSHTALEEEEQPNPGHKYPLPHLPLPQDGHKDYRYDPVINQMTNLILRDGKKAQAQRYIAVMLSTLRTLPSPTYNPTRPLLPGAPPASHLPLHPVLYLTLAIDSVAPLLRIRSQRGAAGGGVALQIPVPLGLRQRRRKAFMWILEAAQKRTSKGSGPNMFPIKLAEEVVAVVEGRSGVWDKRAAVHRLATTARSNLNYGGRKGGGRR